MDKQIGMKSIHLTFLALPYYDIKCFLLLCNVTSVGPLHLKWRDTQHGKLSTLLLKNKMSFLLKSKRGNGFVSTFLKTRKYAYHHHTGDVFQC